MPAWNMWASWSAASSPKVIFRSCSTWAWPACSAPARHCRTLSRFCGSGAKSTMIDSLLERFRQGDRLALSRLLSLLARGQDTDAILGGLVPGPKPARVVAITGSGGVGKSTLVGKLIELLRGK